MNAMAVCRVAGLAFRQRPFQLCSAGYRRPRSLESFGDHDTSSSSLPEHLSSAGVLSDVDERIEEYARISGSRSRTVTSKPNLIVEKRKRADAFQTVLRMSESVGGVDPVRARDIRRMERENSLFQSFLTETIAKLSSTAKYNALRGVLLTVDKIESNSSRGHRKIYIKVLKNSSGVDIPSILQGMTPEFRRTIATGLNLSLTPSISLHILQGEPGISTERMRSLGALSLEKVRRDLRMLYQFEFNR